MKKIIKNILKGVAFFSSLLSFAILGLLGYLAYPSIDWLSSNYGVSFQEILFTLTSPLKGTNLDILDNYICDIKNDLITGCICIFAMISLYFFILRRYDIRLFIGKKKKSITINRFIIGGVVAVVFVSVIQGIGYLNSTLHIKEYFELSQNKSTIYEEYYKDPQATTVVEPEHKKNLIYIYAESMETTYASKQAGGFQESINYIPNLTKLANENISFSNTDLLGGWIAGHGATWTMAGLFSTTSGVPFSFPVTSNAAMEGRQSYVSGITVLGDVLKDYGYVQEFLCGSDAGFAGRREYYSQHGSYMINDLFTARAEGYVSSDYHNGFWGYEDRYLFEIAKDRLLELSKGNEPFNYTLLTVDTHFPGGYICDLCKKEFDNDAANAVACSDSQIYDFIEWCKLQDFYEDTVIIITGDHPRMDTFLVDGASTRPIYNVFINVDIQPVKTTFRSFTAMDMFPTILSALGFQIEGERLGLGTNLFSNLDALAEQMGMDEFNKQISMYSEYYKNFY